MIQIARYGPILDVAIPVVQELTRDGKADVYVPIHPAAAGMAADLFHVLCGFNRYVDAEMCLPDGQQLRIPGSSDKRISNRKVEFRFQGADFAVPDMEVFSSYKAQTILDLKDSTGHFRSKMSVNAKDTNINHRNKKNIFADKLREAGMEISTDRQQITLHAAYQTASDMPVSTFFQFFDPLAEFYRQRVGTKGHVYPVSSSDVHELDRTSWEFFNLPVFWASWSNYYCIALNKLAGNRSYDDAALYYGDRGNIHRHAITAEPKVVEILQYMKDGGDLSRFAKQMKCPYEQMDVFFGKILRSIAWLCNPNSLRDTQKYRYLRNLADSCATHGFRVTPEELSKLTPK